MTLDNRAIVIAIQEIPLPSALANPWLRTRAEHSRQAHSQQFVALGRNVELGYLSFDRLENLSTCVVCDLLVLREYRHRGIGSRLLSFCERIAWARGYRLIRLNPGACDEGVDMEELLIWCAHRDYLPAADGTDRLEKILSRPQARVGRIILPP